MSMFKKNTKKNMLSQFSTAFCVSDLYQLIPEILLSEILKSESAHSHL